MTKTHYPEARMLFEAFYSLPKGDKLGKLGDFEKKMVKKFGSGTMDTFEQHLRFAYTNCRLFEVDDHLKRMLALTKPPNKNGEIHLPHDPMFIDVEFTKEELQELGLDCIVDRIIGIVLSKGKLVSETDGAETGEALRISTCSMIDGEVWFDTFNRNINIDKEYEGYQIHAKSIKEQDKKAASFCHEFAINLLNFINDPFVKLVDVTRTPKSNERRIKKGKITLPSGYKIRLTGELKEYVDKVAAVGEREGYSHMFWVRGHFRTFNSPRYKTMRGKRVWIPPFLKGDGIAIEKPYSLGQPPLEVGGLSCEGQGQLAD